VSYNDAFRALDGVYDGLIAAFDADVNVVGNFNAALTGPVAQKVRQSFTDRVCMVAYVFRVRGHHYLPGLDELYTRLWRKCRYDINESYLNNQMLAVHALHGIFPQILDDYWKNAVDNMLCNGALAKRFYSAPAGFAAPNVLLAGIRDMLLIAPGLTTVLGKEYEYLQHVVNSAQDDRWNGSVNARYYGAKKIGFDEARLGAIAATIHSAYTVLTPDAPLGQSPALQRVANQAPVTGAVLSRAIRQIADRPETVNALLAAPIVDQG